MLKNMSQNQKLVREPTLEQRGVRIVNVKQGEYIHYDLPLLDTNIGGQYVIHYAVTVERISEASLIDSLKIAQAIQK
jgi:hypothetical protein